MKKFIIRLFTKLLTKRNNVAEKKVPAKRKKKTDSDLPPPVPAEAKTPKTEGISHSLTQLYYEIDTVKFMMEMFSDTDLYDHCMLEIDKYNHKELDSYYEKLSQGKSLSKDERKKLEAFCILTNTDLFLVV